jgi:pantoate kinase
LPVSEAFCPAGISSFFEICRVDSSGNPLTDPARIGARGGGFAITHGVKARVVVQKSDRTRIGIRINSKPSPEAHTTRWALEHLLEKTGPSFDVEVNIMVSVPIGAGYGSSAAGTAAACLALADAAELPVTFNELGKITHVAEVVNGTGLGTAAALFVGGFVLVTEPGAPGIGFVDRLLFPKNHSIVCAFLEPLPTREALSQSDLTSRVNPSARRAMSKIHQNPDLYTFLTESRKFGREIGFESPDVEHLIDTMMSAGAIGAAQNMIGKAVHGVAENGKALRVFRLVKKKFPTATVFVSHLDGRGVRLKTHRKPKH